jgi:ABC-type polysaccharide/polyol phosphate export permease
MMPLSPEADIAHSSAEATDTVGGIIATEILAGFRAWPVWMILGWDDIRQRYRRSVLGPLWITLSMGIFILLLGFIYSHLFQMNLKTYIPFLSVGYIIWGFISQTVNDSCMAFQERGHIIRQIKLPYSIYIFRVVWRNFIIFIHTAAIFVVVAAIFQIAPNSTTLLMLPGFFLVCLNLTWVATVIAILNTRYRDMQPIVAACVQIMLFATPIMWPVSSLHGAAIIAELNPLYHLIELVRAPMLGTAPELRSWLIAGSLAIPGSVLATALLVSQSRRIVFWL